MGTENMLLDALTALGIPTAPGTGHDESFDLVVDPAGLHLPVEVKRYSSVTDDLARRLPSRSPQGGILVVVADRITSDARRRITEAGAGYYDLRGHLALRAPGLIVDADVEPLAHRKGRASALGGHAGREVAVALLMRPHGPTSVREVARALGRAASTVSEILAGLRDEGVLTATNTVDDSQLFWLLADHWRTPRTPLAALPDLTDPVVAGALRLGLDAVEDQPGWALTDSAAAAEFGAPVAIRAESPQDFFVPDAATLRRATRLLGSPASPSGTRATVRVAPVPAVVGRRVRSSSPGVAWGLAHPLFVALDLAQDTGRGREVLESWTPEGWPRVW